MNSNMFELRIEGPIAEVRLNRPKLLNAADEQWVADLQSVLDELEARENLRVVRISGEGRAFCTGIDLKALAKGEIKPDWFRRWEEALRRIEMLEAVTIAKLHGYVIGGGLQVALACDLRVAAEGTKLGLPAVLEALIPGLGTYRLPRFIGLGRARRLVLTGELVEAREALKIGLVDWVVADSELEQMTERITEQMLKGAKTAQYLSKRLVAAAFEQDFETICETYLDYQSRSLASLEHRQAMEQYLKSKGY